ncbi:MAG: MYG1 family protein [Candidatus Paceibacterota bacterium]|jgi:uncharacterized UPF0160 family protein
MKINNKKLITHNGSFHADDVFACATLSILLEKNGESFEIIRTRDEEIIKNGDYVFDVGGIYDPEKNRFDHHQLDFKEKRKQDIFYSSFGLVWKKYGEEISGSERGAEMIDFKLVQPVDAFDNGINLVELKHEVVPYLIQHMFLAMHLTWREDKSKTDEMFLKCVEIAKVILKREIIQTTDALLAEIDLIKIYENTEDKRLIILDRKYPYEEILNRFKEPIYVIFQREDENKFWEVEAVRDNFKSFVNRKDFPKSWAGLREEELQKVSGVPDAVFCHKGIFMAIAKSKEGAIKLAQIAIEAD